MTEPPGTRKRDKWRAKLGFGRPASPDNPQIPSSGASNTPAVRAQPLPPSSANAALVQKSVLPTAPTAVAPPTAATPSQSSRPSPSTPAAPAVDLWPDALQKLSQGDQQVIRGIQPTGVPQRPVSERMEELVAMARKKQRECEGKSYKFCFRGREIILRDVAEKTIFWLNKFKAVGDIAMNFDPAHAALPWAGVRFLLQVAVGEQEQMGALLVSVEKVTYLVNRCTIYESLYKPGTTQEQALRNLHVALIELYAGILRLLAFAHRLFPKATVVRAMHALINPSQVSDLLAALQDTESRVEFEAQNCERMRSQEADIQIRELLESLRTPILRTDERVFSLLEKVDEKERLDVLDWISKVLYGKNHDTVKGQRTKDTCEWLLRHNRYREWRDESCSMILWLHGTAGTGKTFLTSRVIDEVQSALKNSPNHEGLAFFYCNRNEAERQEPLSVLRSFVRQLSTITHNENFIQKRLRQFCIQTQLRASEPTMSDCRELLLELANLYPKTTLILDALDECDKHTRRELIEMFDHFLVHASRPIKILISSRPDGDIKERFKSLANIEIQATDNYDDISRFVESEIIKHPRWNRMSSRLQTDIVETLQERSQGMFQWAYLQTKQLLGLKQEKHIRDRLGKLPEDLKDAYDEIYNGMGENERQIANRAFQWVMCSCTPLSTEVLIPAVCQDEDDDVIKPVDDLDEDLLLEYCHNLLVIDPNRGVWIPSHLSVIEYFENHLWSQKQANCLVSIACISLFNNTTLHDEEDESVTGWIQNDSLYNQGFGHLSLYARHHWMIHVQNCEEGNNHDRLSALLKRFLGSPMDSSPAYQSWHKMIKVDEISLLSSSFFINSHFNYNDLGPASSAVFAICAFGFHITLSSWENNWVEYVRKDQEGRLLLRLAVMAGSASICTRLIDWGVQVNGRVPFAKNGTVLAEAAYRGNEEIVTLLLESGADANLLHIGRHGSALAAAASGGSKEVVELLLKSGADVNAKLQVGEHGSALAALGFKGTKEVAELLLESGADVNAQLQTGDYGNALASAASWNNKEIVELLLKSGADVNAQLQTGIYGSVLASAVYWGCREVVELLLKSGANVNAQLQVGKFGSALAAAAAAFMGGKNAVELLIESGADVNAKLQVGMYGSALTAAACSGNKEVVELLLKSKADVNAKPQVGVYGSALAAAAYSGNKEVVELLLKSGADVNAQLQVGSYGSALAAAVATGLRGIKEIVELLLKSGADVNAQLQVGCYGSALVAAVAAVATAFESSGEIVELLLKSGADVNAQLQVGKYSSALAAANGDTKAVDLLVQFGAIVDAPEKC